jgi:hypothetical protein
MAILGELVPETALFTAAFDPGGEPTGVRTFPLTGFAHGFELSVRAAGVLVLPLIPAHSRGADGGTRRSTPGHDLLQRQT